MGWKRFLTFHRTFQQTRLFCITAYLRTTLLVAAGIWCGRGMITALYSVVEIDIANRSKGFVVEAVNLGALAQLFGEMMDGAEVISGGRHFKLAGLQEFLIAAIEQTADFAPEEEARIGRKERFLAVGRLFQPGANPVFLHEDLICDALDVAHIKLMGTEVAENLVECRMIDFNGHSAEPQPEVKLRPALKATQDESNGNGI